MNYHDNSKTLLSRLRDGKHVQLFFSSFIKLLPGFKSSSSGFAHVTCQQHITAPSRLSASPALSVYTDFDAAQLLPPLPSQRQRNFDLPLRLSNIYTDGESQQGQEKAQHSTGCAFITGWALFLEFWTIFYNNLVLALCYNNDSKTTTVLASYFELLVIVHFMH